MTRIRIEPDKLRQTAQRLEDIADRLRALGREAHGITLNAPSYEGQFGPKARTLGLEAEARLVTQADRTSTLSEELIAKAEAFEAADQRSLAALNQLGDSMGEWMEQAAPILAPLVMASAFPWQLIQQHLRLGLLMDPGDHIPLSMPFPFSIPLTNSQLQLGTMTTSGQMEAETPKWLLRILVALETPAAGRATASHTAASTPTPSATATPTPTPTPTATNIPIYLGGLTEAQLAAYQQDQGDRNDCGEFAIAAALNLLYGGSVLGCDVAAAADQVWFPLPSKGLRMWPDGPTTPQQQANIVNGIARQGGLSLSATATKATTADLIKYLEQPDTAVVVTIGWDDTNIPQIARTSDAHTQAVSAGPINGHAMLLVAHDPTHLDFNGNPAPWGFVNSWENGGTEIYWAPDTDFNQAWDHKLPLVGSNNVVVITNAPSTSASTTPTPTATPKVTRAPPPPPQE